MIYQGCSVCPQVALDKTERTAPSSSQPQLGQGISDASNSDSTAGPRKLKPKKKTPAPAAELLEDEGLNAELDAANAGGLVETERDRLIRTVSQLSSSAHAEGAFCTILHLAACMLFSFCCCSKVAAIDAIKPFPVRHDWTSCCCSNSSTLAAACHTGARVEAHLNNVTIILLTVMQL